MGVTVRLEKRESPNGTFLSENWKLGVAFSSNLTVTSITLFNESRNRGDIDIPLVVILRQQMGESIDPSVKKEMARALIVILIFGTVAGVAGYYANRLSEENPDVHVAPTGIFILAGCGLGLFACAVCIKEAGPTDAERERRARNTVEARLARLEKLQQM